MRVRDLRAALDEVRSIFGAAGAKPQEKALAQVSAALSDADSEPLTSYLNGVRKAAEKAAAPPEIVYLERLMNADLDEETFLAVLRELQADKKLKKPSLQKIVKGYTGSFDRRASAAKLIDELKRAFYTKLYERDSRSIARRATPV